MANPISKVGRVTVKCPSAYVYHLQDVSASDAGRTEDGTMDKNRIGQCVKLELKWWNLTTAEASTILNAFNAEYITVEYLDLKTGGFRSAEFYVGDRESPMYNAEMDLWSELSFNIIERKCV